MQAQYRGPTVSRGLDVALVAALAETASPGALDVTDQASNGGAVANRNQPGDSRTTPPATALIPPWPCLSRSAEEFSSAPALPYPSVSPNAKNSVRGIAVNQK